jgi:hypothetical protein
MVDSISVVLGVPTQHVLVQHSNQKMILQHK